MALQPQSSPSAVAVTAWSARLSIRRLSHLVCGKFISEGVAAPAVCQLEKAQQIQVIFLFHPLHHLLCRWSSSPSLQSISFFCHFQQLFYNSVSVTSSLYTEFCNSVEDVEEVIKEKDEEEKEEDEYEEDSSNAFSSQHWVPGKGLGISIVVGKVDPVSRDGSSLSPAPVTGIFIKNLLEGSLAGDTNQRHTGDRILEVDGHDLRSASLEPNLS